MANSFYNVSGSPSVGSQGSSVAIRGELLAVQNGFELFPSLSVADSYVVTNSAGTAYTVIAGKPSTSWTPTLTCQTPGNLSVAYSTRVGQYARCGKFIYTTFAIVTSTFTHTTASGFVIITGMPVGQSGFGGLELGGIHGSGWNTTGSQTQIGFSFSGTDILFVKYNDLASTAAVNITEFPTGGTVTIRGCIIYVTDSST